MKSKLRNSLIVLAMLALSTLNSELSTGYAQGTAFTYQGQLLDGDSAADGFYDLRFHLYDSVTNGTLIAGPLTNLDTPVSNGLFTVTIDFGNVFDGTVLWLQIGVRTNGSTNFVGLSSRQELTPTPFAIFAEGANAAGLSGTIPMASLNGTYGAALDLTNAGNSFAGNGAGLRNVNAITLGGLASSSFWQLGGNNAPSGAFLGTTNDQSLDFKVNNARALRLRLTTDGLGLFTNAPNVIMGSSVNADTSTSVGGTVSGGGGNDMSGNAYPNGVTADFGTVGGGIGNTASGRGSFVGGGGYDGSSVQGNNASGAASVIGGGVANTNTGRYATVGGGEENTVIGELAVVGGGYNNVLGNSYGAFIGGGYQNVIQVDAYEATIGGGWTNFIASNAELATIGGGHGNQASNRAAIVGGGEGNSAVALGATVAGGTFNTANGTNSTVGGGSGNVAAGADYGFATVAGGQSNTSLSYATVGGGLNNTATGFGSFVGGGGFDGNSFDTSPNAALGNGSVVVGGVGNVATGKGATVGGGIDNWALGDYSMVLGGLNNYGGGTNSFAAGNNAAAGYDGSFVWSDSTGTYTQDGAVNQFVARASGGFFFYTDTGYDGAKLNPGDSSWTTLSDRNAKKDIEPEDCRAVLNKLAQVPIAHWHYKWEPETNTPHIGPMAQDFKHAFYPGRDDKGITTLEFDGVELAAIQGLNQKLEQESKAKDAQIQTLKQQNDSLAARLNELEATVRVLASRK